LLETLEREACAKSQERWTMGLTTPMEINKTGNKLLNITETNLIHQTFSLMLKDRCSEEVSVPDHELEIDNLKLFYSAILDALTANIAVIDSAGTILMVNEAWRRFGAENKLVDDKFCVGTNYLDVCEASKLDPDARQATAGIRLVLSGETDEFSFEYSCDSPWEKRRFRFSATQIKGFQHFAVVSHERLKSASDEATASAAISSAKSNSKRDVTPDAMANVPRTETPTTKITEMTIADSEHVSTVCAWCNALRVEYAGKFYWHSPPENIEALVLSHGICPSCQERLSKN
jgi:hypothetical protein